MAVIAPFQLNHCITPSNDEEAPLHADGATWPTTPPSSETLTSSALASHVPDGGLHPVAHEPGKALFGFITDKLREILSKESPPASPPAEGGGGTPGASADIGGLGKIGMEADRWRNFHF